MIPVLKMKKLRHREVQVSFTKFTAPRGRGGFALSLAAGPAFFTPPVSGGAQGNVPCSPFKCHLSGGRRRGRLFRHKAQAYSA